MAIETVTLHLRCAKRLTSHGMNDNRRHWQIGFLEATLPSEPNPAIPRSSLLSLLEARPNPIRNPSSHDLFGHPDPTSTLELAAQETNKPTTYSMALAPREKWWTETATHRRPEPTVPRIPWRAPPLPPSLRAATANSWDGMRGGRVLEPKRRWQLVLNWAGETRNIRSPPREALPVPRMVEGKKTGEQGREYPRKEKEHNWQGKDSTQK